MIIDIHTHEFPDKIAAKTKEVLQNNSHSETFSDLTLRGLIDTEAKAGIDLAVIVPVATKPSQVESINNSAYEINERFGGKTVLSFAAMHPDFPEYKKELKRLVEMGFKGIKLHPAYQGHNIDDIEYLRIMDEANSLGLAIITHGGIDIGFPTVDFCSPEMTRHAINEIGDFPLIVAHMGGWKDWERVPEYLADTSVLIDTSASLNEIVPKKGDEHYYSKEGRKLLDADGFMKLFNAFGQKRILFGTDNPWSDPAADIEFIKNLPISEDEKEDIFYNNARKILDI